MILSPGALEKVKRYRVSIAVTANYRVNCAIAAPLAPRNRTNLLIAATKSVIAVPSLRFIAAPKFVIAVPSLLNHSNRNSIALLAQGFCDLLATREFIIKLKALGASIIKATAVGYNVGPKLESAGRHRAMRDGFRFTIIVHPRNFRSSQGVFL
jgi:hypothetical protein